MAKVKAAPDLTATGTDSDPNHTRVKALKTDAPNELPPVTREPVITKLPNGTIRTDY